MNSIFLDYANRSAYFYRFYWLFTFMIDDLFLHYQLNILYFYNFKNTLTRLH